VDVRILATSSQDLEPLVHTGAFREDLYYRLNVISLHVPPLRERREDIPPLARHFARMFSPAGVPVATITKEAMDGLLRYDWPGNVRQLRNEIERAVALVSSEPAPTITLEALSTPITDAPASAHPASDAPEDILHPDCNLDDVLARTEKSIIERVLAEYDGQVTASARELGLTRQGLYKKMKRLDIDAAAFHPETSVASASA
jgi:DNA-binding NtrC family response regulator